MSHLNPVTKDINLHSVCQLQQKIIETGMSLRLTRSRSYPGNVGVDAKASVVQLKQTVQVILPGPLPLPHTTFSYTSISGIEIQVTFKLPAPSPMKK